MPETPKLSGVDLARAAHDHQLVVHHIDCYGETRPGGSSPGGSWTRSSASRVSASATPVGAQV